MEVEGQTFEGSSVSNESTGQEVSVQETRVLERPEPQQEVAVQTGSSEVAQSSGSEQKQVASWQPPSWKVTAYEKEYDFPEDFRPHVNEKNYEKYKSVIEKSIAFDTAKQKYKEVLSKYQEIAPQYKNITANLDKMSRFVQNGDFDSFFAAIKIPEQAIMQWVHKKLQLRDLPPEQQSLYTKNSEYQRELMQREEELEALRREREEFESDKLQSVIEKRHNQLDNYMRTKYAALVSAYDAKVGKPGAFKEEVILRAAALSQARQEEVSVEEAVDSFGKVLELGGFGATQTANPTPEQTRGSKPTIPNIKGGATSPVAPQVKSLSDLKKLAKRAQLQES